MHLFVVGDGNLVAGGADWAFYIVAICAQRGAAARDDSKRGLWLLPLPNQYEDGKMCFNENVYNPRTAEFPVSGCAWPQAVAKAVELLQVRKWAADVLFNDWKKRICGKLFRWQNAEGFPQITELPGDVKHWTKCCQNVSASTLNLFFQQWSTCYGITI
jgi:hypothetical protein